MITSEISHGDDVAMTARGAFSGTPIYRQLTDTLRAAIESGEYPVGSLLPTEVEISHSFGVSRHTVRDALRILSGAGLIQRRRRVGTVVTANTQFTGFIQTLPGFEEILQAGRDLRLTIASYDGPLACPLAEELTLESAAWVRVDGRRGPEDRLLGLSTILIRRDHAPLKTALQQEEMSLDDLMQKSPGVIVGKVDQNISAISLDRQMAKIFGTVVGAPALRARRYYYEQGELIIATESIHPADRFSYTLSFTRNAAGNMI